MYYEHFGLSQPPFKITPNTAFFFPGGNRGPILDALVYAITQGEGIIKVTGEVGSGKTMLCRMLEASLPDTVETIYLANPSVEPGEILHAIAFDMHLDIPKDASRQQVMQLLQAYLVQRHAAGKQVVIFVEEAQATPIATLEEIRLLSNLETQHHKLLQIVLFGQPELDEILAEPAIRQLKERITHSFRLDPLNTTDIRAYLDFRMRQAGYKGPDVFSVGAVREIARASIGLTRRVNIIADKALLAAYTEQKHDISARHVFAAAQDSEFTDIVPRKLWGLGLAGIGLLLLGIGLGVALSPLFKSSVISTPPTPVSATAVPATPAPPPTVIAEQVKDIVDSRLAATDDWLANTPPETVGIHVQLLGAGDRKRLENYLAELGKSVDIAQVFVYRTKAGGKPAYSVIYGSYPNRVAANAALAQLPAKLQAQRPYLRTVQGMRAEIGAALLKR
ncbi:MAG: AAA family ATPase [Burkholderiales bacterium]|nr:AAA family ATPase [Burkholderiales bacterium]